MMGEEMGLAYEYITTLKTARERRSVGSTAWQSLPCLSYVSSEKSQIIRNGPIGPHHPINLGVVRRVSFLIESVFWHSGDQTSHLVSIHLTRRKKCCSLISSKDELHRVLAQVCGRRRKFVFLVRSGSIFQEIKQFVPKFSSLIMIPGQS